jgi:hypothetical protein
MAPVLLDSAISSMPRMRACRFSSVVSAGRPANCGRAGRRKPASPARWRSRRSARRAAHHLARVVQAHLRRVGRRHHHRAHLVGAERIDRDRQRQRRIDAARQADDRAREAVLAEVIAHPSLSASYTSASSARAGNLLTADPGTGGVARADRHALDEAAEPAAERTVGDRAQRRRRRTPARPGRPPCCSKATGSPVSAHASRSTSQALACLFMW